MAENSEISWCDHTWNPWWGCTIWSTGCSNCYALTLSKRFGFDIWGPKAERRFFGAKHWAEPLKWNKKAEAEGVRRRVFCASMADVFERHMLPNIQSLMTMERSRLWELIDQTPMLDWLLLTKRPENIIAMIPIAWTRNAPHNVWYGTSCENQEYADRRIPELLRVPAAVRFLSCEPLLGPMDLTPWLQRQCGHPCHDFFDGVPCQCVYGGLPRIEWVIAGGESGPKARPMHPDWARSLRDQCQSTGIAYHFKQWGEWIGAGQVVEYPTPDGKIYRWPDGAYSSRIGKKAAGRLLDGVEWNEFPVLEATNV